MCYSFGGAREAARKATSIQNNWPKTFLTSCGKLIMRRTGGTVSDTGEPSYLFIDRVIWAVLMIAIVGIGVLIVSNL